MSLEDPPEPVTRRAGLRIDGREGPRPEAVSRSPVRGKAPVGASGPASEPGGAAAVPCGCAFARVARPSPVAAAPGVPR